MLNPLVNEKIDQVTLTPVNAYSASGVVFLNEAPKLPFTLTFRFNIFDDDGSAYNIWNSADGIALMIGKDESSYKKGNPPIGGTMGHIDDGTGVTLFFKTYGKRELILKDPKGKILASKAVPAIYTHKKWQAVRLEVTKTSINVNFDSEKVLSWEGELPELKNTLAFGAATGAANSMHQIKDVKINH